MDERRGGTRIVEAFLQAPEDSLCGRKIITICLETISIYNRIRLLNLHAEKRRLSQMRVSPRGQGRRKSLWRSSLPEPQILSLWMYHE